MQNTKPARRSRGFTLMEIIIAVAIVALLAAIALPGYQLYMSRARATEVVAKFDALRSGLGADVAQGGSGLCQALVQRAGSSNLSDPHVVMSVQLEQLGSGAALAYRPVLSICARESKQGRLGVGIARGVHDDLVHTGVVEPGAVLTDSTVSFALALTDRAKASCQVAYSSGLTPCGDVLAAVMQFAGPDTFVRPAGGRLNTNGPLDAFTLEMSFIGDGSVAAASGGQGPVMFNYGDSSNSHNAISLWNPRSLTVALSGRDYDTGVNLVDGKTHRVTVSWDKATGVLSVYDNGAVVKSFSGVSQGQAIAGNGMMVLAHKANSDSGGYNPREAFAGQIFHTSLANVAVGADRVGQPLNQVLAGSPNLLTDLRAQGSAIRDTTGRHQVESGGVTTVMTGVDASLAGR